MESLNDSKPPTSPTPVAPQPPPSTPPSAVAPELQPANAQSLTRLVTPAPSQPRPPPPYPSDETKEVELVDWDEAESEDDEEDDELAIDEGAEKPASSAAVMATAGPLPPRGAFYIGDGIRRIRSCQHAGSGNVTPSSPSIRPPPQKTAPMGPVPPRPAAPPKLKSILLVSGRPPASHRRHQKQVWRRLDLSSLPGSGSHAAGAPSPKPSATPIRMGINSSSASCWENGEPSRINEEQAGDLSPKWQKAREKYWWRKPDPLSQDQASPMAPHLQKMGASTAPRSFLAHHAATIKRLAGRCYRCLAKDHRVTQCRDPIRCLECGGPGHTSRFYKSRRHRPISANLRARLCSPR